MGETSWWPEPGIGMKKSVFLNCQALVLGDFGKPPLLLDAWAYVDMVVLFAAYITFFGETFLQGVAGSASTLRSLRLLRAIRPLRIMNRLPGMRLLIQALTKAPPSLFTNDVCAVPCHADRD